MTLRQAALVSLEVQDACNLSGVLQSFRGIVMDVLWPAAREQGKGTDWVNQHPICVLFIDKLSALARSQFDDMAFSHAYDECLRLARVRPEIVHGWTQYVPDDPEQGQPHA